MTTLFGYARVSSTDQDLDLQLAALKAAGCEVIRSEKVSGTSTNGRTELRNLLEFIRVGDVLIVTRIDRLARSIADLAAIVRELEAKGAALKAIEQPIDTSTAADGIENDGVMERCRLRYAVPSALGRRRTSVSPQRVRRQ